MARVCQVAVARGVAIGARVLVDREGFGRRRLTVAFDTFVSQLAEQLPAARRSHSRRRWRHLHTRPHGALYNAALVDDETAEAVVTATPERMPVLCLPGTALAAAAERAGRPVVPEISPIGRSTTGDCLSPADLRRRDHGPRARDVQVDRLGANR